MPSLSVEGNDIEDNEEHEEEEGKRVELVRGDDSEPNTPQDGGEKEKMSEDREEEVEKRKNEDRSGSDGEGEGNGFIDPLAPSKEKPAPVSAPFEVPSSSLSDSSKSSSPPIGGSLSSSAAPSISSSASAQEKSKSITFTYHESVGDRMNPLEREATPFPINTNLNERIYLWKGEILRLDVDAIVCGSADRKTRYQSTLSQKIAGRVRPLLCVLRVYCNI